MKTLHVVYTFKPEPIGGTEVYVEALCRALVAGGDEAVLAAPGRRDDGGRIDGVAVRRFAFDSEPDLSVIYGRPDPIAVSAFERLLDEERPDLVHQHAISPACSVGLMQLVKARGMPVVFTYHTPTSTCLRGTLLEHGHKPCDGRLEPSRCAVCTIERSGVRPAAAAMLGRVPSQVADLVERLDLHGHAWTALRMRTLVARHQQALAGLFSIPDRFVSLAPWVRQLLETNAVDGSRIVDCPHGVIGAAERRSGGSPSRPQGVLRMAHLGRVDPLKGTKLLIDAIRAMPAAGITLDVFGIVQGSAAEHHASALLRAAESDPRIRFRAPIPHADVVPALAAYDLVAVPSQWMETGPLVVLEAFAAGVPVIGSALGGIADKVRPDVDGVLIAPFDSREAWRAGIERLAQDPAHVNRLRAGVRAPRAMADVVAEMGQLYRLLAA